MMSEGELRYCVTSVDGSCRQIQISKGWGGINEGVEILSKVLPKNEQTRAKGLLVEIKESVHNNLKTGGVFTRAGEQLKTGRDLTADFQKEHFLWRDLSQQVVLESRYDDLRKEYGLAVEGLHALSILAVVLPAADRFLTVQGKHFAFQVDPEKPPYYPMDFEKGLAIKIRGLIARAYKDGLTGFFQQQSALKIAYGAIIKERDKAE